PFPSVVPEGAWLQEGVLALSISPAYQATVTASAASRGPQGRETEDAAASPDLPWGKQVPVYYYAYRGQAVTGTVTLKLRPPQVRAQCTSEVVLASGRAAVVLRLRLQPEVGSPQAIDLAMSAPTAALDNWTTLHGNNQVRRVERLPGAGPEPARGGRW